jgi:hypothetical protein
MPTDKDCQKKGEYSFFREGTSQAQRFPDALKPASAPIDERRLEHGMVFAKAYSEYLRYYDSSNAEVDNWSRFFSDDVSVMLAEAAIQNIDYYRLKVKSCFDVLKNSKSGESDLKQNLGYLFSAAGTLASQLDLLKERLPDDMPLKGMIRNLIQRQLAPAFKRLVAYYKADNSISDPGKRLIGSDPAPDLKIFESECEPFDIIYQSTFSGDWITDAATKNWNDYVTAIPADATVYGIETGVFNQINHIATHNLFSSVFDLFLKTYARASAEATKALAENLANRDDHQPHYALFLSFLQLMGHARDYMNTLTGKHLDFYYKEVLRLKEKPAEPNHAHLLIQLAKNRETALLKQKTAFNGGKDSLGKEVTYTLDNDFVANMAAVKALKSVYNFDSKLYAYPVTNSDDGQGAELTSVDKKWHPFIGKTESNNLATLGFAISSHYLLLGENQRKIRLKLAFTTPPVISQAAFCNAFDFLLTGEKEWISASVDMNALPEAKKNKLSTNSVITIDIPLVLEGNLPAVVALDRKKHGEALPEGVPALKMVLKPDISSETLKTLRSLTIVQGNCSLEVCVGYDSFSSVKPNENGLKNLTVHTKFGQVKPDKPFQPFGPLPEKNDALIIGCDEVFQKKNACFQFRLVWKGLPAWRGDIDFDWVNAFYPNVSLTLLKNGTWGSTPDVNNVSVFYDVQPDIYFPTQKVNLYEHQSAVADIHFEPMPYTQESRNGFMKLTLLDDFGHVLYRLTLSRYLLRLATKDNVSEDRMKAYEQAKNAVYKQLNDKTWVPKNKATFIDDYVEWFSMAMPVEPYTPQIESLTLSYSASVTLSDEDVALNWLTPFGYQSAETGGNATLLPEYKFEGEFYIGIEKLSPGQNLSLLFQLAEGSANPVLEKPENHVAWSCLANNEWLPLNDTTQSDNISDQTGQLTRSGIIRFSVPKEATQTDSLFLASGLIWLRAVVATLPDAVCKVIEVVAQATQVTFSDQQNAEDFLASQLPNGSIAKLSTPDAAIKKVVQPYPTFGGRPKESSDAFYVRVSERLRHKNRAITLWDYERLVLEAFPQIYKVKCLNHTYFKPGDNGTSIYRENAPGHVTIITIPNLRNHNAFDPLAPNTNLGDLALIEEFLARHVTGFLATDLDNDPATIGSRLHVCNPVFESIRADFKVKFVAGTDASFYIPLLQSSLVNFLSPWASGEGKDISFGGKIYKSSLIDFVEEQPYVDYVTDFKLFHKTSDNTESKDMDEVSASMAISILVSAKAGEHKISEIND